MSRFLGLIILGGAGFAGWKYWQTQQAVAQTPIPVPQPIMVSAPAPTVSTPSRGDMIKDAILGGALNYAVDNADSIIGGLEMGNLGGFFGGLFGGNKGGEGGSDPEPQAVPQPTSVSFPAILPAIFPTPSTGGEDIGPNGADFGATERKYGLPNGFMRTMAHIESSMNPAAKNPRSSAGGLFQFIDSTARRYGLYGNDRFDAQKATDAAGRLARDNARILKPTIGRSPTGGELYLAHQQGGAGARKLLRDRNANAVSVVGSAQVKLNGGNESMTAGQFADLWINKYKRFHARYT